MQETSSSPNTVNNDVDTFLNDPCRELFTQVKYPTVKHLLAVQHPSAIKSHCGAFVQFGWP